MSLRLYPSVRASGVVPDTWHPLRRSAIKYPVRNAAVQRELRRLLPGRWQKVIKAGTIGEVHYVEHKSGSVAGVKFLRSAVRR